MGDKYECDLKFVKQRAKQDARELHYRDVMPDVYKRINACKTENEVYRVLITCRHML